jgi:hypothetical protein
MSTSTYLGSKSSNGDTLHETLKTHPLLFRLHSLYCHTWFDPERKFLLASSHAQRYANALRSGEDPSHILEDLKDACSSSTLREESESVAKHITSWRGNRYPSTFISLTFNVLFVYWEWKRRTHKAGQHEDAFVIIVIEGSELDNKRAELATKILGEEGRGSHAFHFAQSAGEVIVKDYISSQAILGSIPMSRLQEFIPSWCSKPVEKALPREEMSFKSFLDKIDANEAKCVQESLRFALELLAPMLVPSVVGSGAVTESSAEGVNPSDTASRQKSVEEEYVPLIKLALESETHRLS